MPSNDRLDRDAALRARAISHVEALALRHGEVLPAAVIERGFEVDGQIVHLQTRARGIFAPAGDRLVGALSVKTSVPRPGRSRWYDDAVDLDESLFRYKFQGTDPEARDNRLVRACRVHALPLIYFRGVAPARYQAIVCMVVGEDPATLEFALAPISRAEARANPVLRVAALRPQPPREYAVHEARRRLHQSRFREMVLDAYLGRCTVCRLPRRELLDGAHIIPDGAEGGEPVVQNGLALCKLHHAAYDRQVLGITPDGDVHVSPEVLDAQDGPVLEYGLKKMHGGRIHPPRRKSDYPDRDRLARRWSALDWRPAG